MADPELTDAAPADPASADGAVSLMRLPNELLFAVSGLLDLGDVARLMRTSRFFYQLLVNMLYQRDADNRNEGTCNCCSMALRWGCLTSNADTLRRALAAPDADLARSWPHALAMALDSACPSPLTTLKCLLDHGAPVNVPAFRDRHGKPIGNDGQPTPATFWPLLTDILDAATLPPRWCPVPVVACFLTRGATLAVDDDDDAALPYVVSATWNHVLGLVQVRGPRQWRWPHASSMELRHDHCLHEAVPCKVALTRLLLQQGAADPNVVFVGRHRDGSNLDDSLLLRAIADPRRPVEVLQCLVDAGADLRRLYQGDGKDNQEHAPPLHAILEDAVRLRSLASYPRRYYWDCYPGAVRYPKAEAILRFLLARGLPFEDGGVHNGHQRSGRGGGSGNGRTLWLLDRWDQRWQRFCKRPGRTLKNRAGQKTKNGVKG